MYASLSLNELLVAGSYYASNVANTISPVMKKSKEFSTHHLISVAMVAEPRGIWWWYVAGMVLQTRKLYIIKQNRIIMSDSEISSLLYVKLF